MSNITHQANEVFRLFHDQADRLARDTHWTQRQSKLSGSRFAAILICGLMSRPDASLEDLASYARAQGIPLTKQALDQRFNAACVAFLKQLLALCLTTFHKHQTPLFQALQGFSKIKIIDSTHVTLPAALADTYPSLGGHAGSAGLKMQAILDYLSGQLEQVEFTSSRCNDQAYTAYQAAIQPGELHLQDLGYFRLDCFQALQEAGAYFVSRYYTQAQLLDPQTGCPLNLETLLDSQTAAQWEYQAWLGQNAQIPVRVIAQRVPDEVAQQRKHQLNKHARKKGYQARKRTLALQHWTLYLTNLPADEYSAPAIQELYRLRWQIELFFKLCKSQAGLASGATRSKEARVLCTLYAKLIGVALTLFWTPQSSQERSLPKAFSQFKMHALDLLRALRSRYRLKQFLTRLRELWLQLATKDQNRRSKQSTYQKIKGHLQTGEHAHA